MGQPDAALGIAAGFDEPAFRNAISFAMQMGRPNDPDRAPVFLKKASGRTYWKKIDGVDTQLDPATVRTGRQGEPLDPEVRVVKNPDQEVRVDCAIETEDVPTTEIPTGNFKPLRAVVTVMDTEYAKLEGVKELRYNGDRYQKDHEPDIMGLFGADVHVLVFYALDES